MRANILNFPARIFGSEGVSAHFGSGAESNTQKTASFSLEFLKKGHRESWSDLWTFTITSPTQTERDRQPTPASTVQAYA